jgi:hypothetical protein
MSKAALFEDVVGYLENDTDVQNLLGADGGIVPAAIASEEDDLDPRVTIGVSRSGSSRNNRRTETEYDVRVIVDATDDRYDDPVLSLIELQDAVTDVLEKHQDDRSAEGVDSDEEVAWSDAVNRYLAVTSFTFSEDAVNHSQISS